MRLKSLLSQNTFGTHKIAYTEWGKPSDRHPPILCVHALTFNGRSFDRLAKALSHDRQVICPDVVGRGKSNWLPDPSLYGYPLYLADIKTLLAHLGVKQVDWVGTSMGGIMGMMMAALPNSPIRRLILNDVGAFISRKALKNISDYLHAAPPSFKNLKEAELYLRKTYASFGRLSKKDWQHLAKHDTRMLPDGTLMRTYDPAIGGSVITTTKAVDLWPLYDSILCPTLLLHGETSDLLSNKTAIEMTRRGPKPKLVTFRGIGHAPPLMNSVQIKIVKDFLSAPPKAPPCTCRRQTAWPCRSRSQASSRDRSPRGTPA